ncbi:MAG: alkylation response protein AidB-like acyl-CoA dehydrogenase [Oceanicoccus sp.]|jgi:alkylation response protein AidB-like acyl-CoA dehydrogenase
MQIQLSKSTRQWQQKVRDFAEQELIPWEVEAELNNGELPDGLPQQIQHKAIALGLSKMDAPLSVGGQNMSMVDQVAAWESLGRVTNALCWCFPEAQHWMFEACGDNDHQLNTYLLPMMRGERRECYAITEAESGSHEVVNSSARKVNGGYLLNGEKWFVTSANIADFFFFQAKTDSGEDALFFVDCDTAGISMTENPAFSHTFPSHHPTYLFKDVFIPEKNRLGEEGAGMDYSRSWFRHERLTISARMLGAASRMIEEATTWAKQREVQGEKLFDKQAIQFMLADCVAELWASKLMVYEAAAAHDRGDDLKSLHAQCSVVKLYSTEMANRVADRCLQIWGGRGYRRDNAIERFFREVRVDRIWEGSSEIQRMIIAKALGKRGLEGM